MDPLIVPRPPETAAPPMKTAFRNSISRAFTGSAERCGPASLSNSNTVRTLWTIGYTKVSQGQFLKTALPFGWLMVAICSAICYAWLG